MSHFWKTLPKPLIGPSPMDGVTDAAYRYIMDTYGHPSLLMTEFTNVEGLSRGAIKILNAFIYHKTATPTVAQIYGTTPDSFYKSTILVCEMGFDGVDINMGCPDKSISGRGAGAGLIRTPKLAQEIIRAVKQATYDFAEGKTIHDTELPETVKEWVDLFKAKQEHYVEHRSIPVSVKTRIGFDEIITEEWMKYLLEEKPANISLHGRTLKQMYTGEANWEEIGKAAQMVKQTETTFLGNGDVKSLADARKKIKDYNLDGILIGRASFGNPWIFNDHVPTQKEQIQMAIEHCESFTRLTPDGHFASLRKHLAWYTKGLPGSNELRNTLMRVNSVQEVKDTFAYFEESARPMLYQ